MVLKHTFNIAGGGEHVLCNLWGGVGVCVMKCHGGGGGKKLGKFVLRN